MGDAYPFEASVKPRDLFMEEMPLTPSHFILLTFIVLSRGSL